MKLIISWFLVFATLVGVLTGTDGICLDTHGPQIVAKTTAHSDGASTSNCQHEGSPCHTCHLGHCAFVVSTASTHFVAPVNEIVLPSYLVSHHSGHTSSLFRPPIA